MGAAAFVGVARDVFIFGHDPDEEDKYAHTMSEIRNKVGTTVEVSHRGRQGCLGRERVGGYQSEVVRCLSC